MIYEPLSHYTRLETIALPCEASLAEIFRRQGLTVIETSRRQPSRQPAPWRPYSCVEAVKRLLGLRAGWVLTPWQLYRHLREYEINTRNRKISLDGGPQAP